jgi:hypothetical protein
LGRRERALLGCGVVAGPLFFAVFSVAGASRAGYDPLRHPVSSLEFGPSGWVQSVNFVLTGVLVVLFAWAARAIVRSVGGGRTVWILLTLVGLGLVGAGFFPPDPLSGYPPGSAPTAPDPSLHRVLHDLFSTPVFTALPAAAVVMARRFARVRLRAWAVCSAHQRGLRPGVVADPDRGTAAAADPGHRVRLAGPVRGLEPAARSQHLVLTDPRAERVLRPAAVGVGRPLANVGG